MGSQTKFPTLAEGTNWTTPENVFADDAARATFNHVGQNDLIITGFDFTIPPNATIDGIVVNTQGQGASGTAAQRQVRIGLTKDASALAGTRKTGIEYAQSADTNMVSGTSSDLWGTTWTAVEINNQDFGILLSDNDATAALLSIDVVSITVHYTLPAYPTTNPTPSYIFEEDVEFKTQISEFEGKMEQRHQKWEEGRHRFVLNYENLTDTDMTTIWDFYKARKGAAQDFTFVNPRDSVAYVCRFEEDRQRRGWFAADLHQGIVKIIESLAT